MTHSSRHFPVYYLVGLIIGIALINLLANYFHLYFYIWWLDIPMHMLGGLWIGLTALVIYYQSHKRRKKDRSTIFVYCFALLSALFVGLVWEIYEFAVDHAVEAFEISLGDSLKDLIDDLIGGAVAAGIFVHKRYNREVI